jgi:hypothetical protein
MTFSMFVKGKLDFNSNLYHPIIFIILKSPTIQNNYLLKKFFFSFFLFLFFFCFLQPKSILPNDIFYIFSNHQEVLVLYLLRERIFCNYTKLNIDQPKRIIKIVFVFNYFKLQFFKFKINKNK